MGQRETSVVRQRSLGTELRLLREGFGRTPKVVAEALGWSTTKICRIETGVVNVSTSDVMALIHYYGIDEPDLVEQLLSATRTMREGWWTEYRSGLFSRQFLNCVGYEDSASCIMQYMHQIVPGLLQTEEYAKVLMSYYGQQGQDEVDRGIRIRMQRQELLNRPTCPELLFVLDEAILHRWVGGPVVMLGQLRHLGVLTRHSRISIRIVPFTEGLHAGMRGSSFTVFKTPLQGHIVNLEDPHRDMVVSDPETSLRYIESFRALQQIACLEWEVEKMIDPLIDRLGSM